MTIPKIQSALNGWESRITLSSVVSQTIDDRGIKQDVLASFKFKGVIQPLSPEQMSHRPAGDRSWQNWQIHTRTKLTFQTGDQVTYLGKSYKIEAKLDYELNNYYEYHLLKKYE